MKIAILKVEIERKGNGFLISVKRSVDQFQEDREEMVAEELSANRLGEFILNFANTRKMLE